MKNSIDKNLIKKLKIKSDFKAIVDLSIRFLYHITFIYLAYYFFSIKQYTLFIVFALPHWMMYSFLGSGGLSHELFHNSVFSNNKINNILFKTFMILNWENYNYFKLTHSIHHKITLNEKDPKSLFKNRINVVYLIQLLTFDFKLFLNKIKHLLKNCIGIIPNNKSSYLFPKNSSERKGVTKVARIIFLFHVTSMIIFLISNMWVFIFLINLSPFIFSFFNRFLAFSQHYGLQSDNHTDYIKNCRTVILPKFWSFFYSNMNYHIEHHMYPFIPYYNIVNIHRELVNDKNYKNISHGWIGLIRDLHKYKIFKIIYDK